MLLQGCSLELVQLGTLRRALGGQVELLQRGRMGCLAWILNGFQVFKPSQGLGMQTLIKS